MTKYSHKNSENLLEYVKDVENNQNNLTFEDIKDILDNNFFSESEKAFIENIQKSHEIYNKKYSNIDLTKQAIIDSRILKVLKNYFQKHPENFHQIINDDNDTVLSRIAEVYSFRKETIKEFLHDITISETIEKNQMNY